MSADTPAIDAITLQIIWNRLISVVEEQAQILVRTAFSNTVREAGDLSAGLFDLEGRMIAQAVTGTPGHVNSMANAVRHFIAAFPVDTLSEGDHLVTNDPWQCSGHLHDFTVVTPAFHRGRIVGLIANTCHVVDIGGRGFGPDGRQVYEEGLYVPLMKLADRGVMNETLLAIVRGNVREPVLVEGDLYSFAASNDEGCRRLSLMMDEFGLDSLDEIGRHILERSRQSTLDQIRGWPSGTYRYRVTLDGYDTPIHLVAAVTISADGMHVDFEGTSPASRHGINVVLNYTEGYTCFGLKCLVSPDVPNNAGSLAPFTLSAPVGSIVNVQRPLPVAARHIIGHALPDLMMGCLYQARTDGIPAENSAVNWQPQLRGGPGASGDAMDGPAFNLVTFNSGGTGGRPGKDGLSATAFPSGIRGMAVETSEHVAPVIFWKKEFRPGSAGPGRWRGGYGQIMEISSRTGHPMTLLAMFDRADHPAKGRDGGLPGAKGRVLLGSGTPLRAKGEQTIPAGDRLRLELPGGGGLGDPWLRDPALVARDVLDGLIDGDAAREVYGVAVGEDHHVDLERTRRLRTAPER